MTGLITTFSFPTSGPLPSVLWAFNWKHDWRIISLFVMLMWAARAEQQLHSCSRFVALVNISCFPVQAFLTLARDIKAKMDKKLVSTNLFRSVWDMQCRISSTFVVVLGGQQPPGQQSRSKDHGAAQEEQFLPLHTPVRSRSDGIHLCLNCVPHWMELEHMNWSFFITYSPSSSTFWWFVLNVAAKTKFTTPLVYQLSPETCEFIQRGLCYKLNMLNLESYSPPLDLQSLNICSPQYYQWVMLHSPSTDLQVIHNLPNSHQITGPLNVWWRHWPG